MKTRLIATAIALATCASVHAETYWLKKAAVNYAAPPKCFSFYSDEAYTTEVSITPSANDGNTYVVMGSSKMTGNYTATEGTTWIFGKDGSTVGTKKASADITTDGGKTFNFGACTIYGISINVNAAGVSNWAGTNTLVYCGNEFRFNAMNMGNATPRGFSLSGKFISEKDVTIKMQRKNGDDTPSAHKISGDFTNFKGGILLDAGSSATQINSLELTSASAFGDPSVERADYLTVGNFTRWSIGGDVTQSAAKGIALDLSESGTSAMCAADKTSWMLSAPVTAKNGTGTLAKTGAGTVTLAGSLSVPSLDVKEGTLVIDTTATFEQATTLTIRSGATVITRQGTSIPNVTVVKEEGAILSLDYTVPYADGATTALDYSALTAEGWAGLDKPLPLKLSAPIAHPVNEALRLPVLRLPSSLGATAADFSDTTAKTYDLPVTSFEVVSGEDECDVVYLNVRPVVYLAATKVSNLLAEKQEDAATWTDGQAAHAGADYVVANGVWAAATPGWYGEWTFPGESLVFASGAFTTKAKRNVFNRLVLYGGAQIKPYGYCRGDSVQVIDGECRIASGTVTVTALTQDTGRSVVDFAGSLTGSGVLKFEGSSGGLNMRISGDGTAFDGTIQNAMASDGSAGLLECADLNRLLAPRTAFSNYALCSTGNFSGFHVTEDGTFADNGFSLTLNGYRSAISVAEAKTLAVTGKMMLGQTVTRKLGGGTLALAGTTLYSTDGQANPEATYGGSKYYFQLFGGWVKPVAWNGGVSYYRTRFQPCQAGAGFSFDVEPTDEHIAKYGLCLAYDDSVSFGSGIGTLPVKILFGEDGTRVKNRIVLPVLTVTDALAETLAGKLSVVQNFRDAQAIVTSAPAADMEGFTTFTVTLRPNGFSIRIR